MAAAVVRTCDAGRRLWGEGLRGMLYHVGVWYAVGEIAAPSLEDETGAASG